MHRVDFFRIHRPLLCMQAQKLPHTGVLCQADNGYTYLDIDDSYIYTLHPLLVNAGTIIHRPDYFGEGGIGAHISVIYKEERAIHGKQLPIGGRHSFEIYDLCYANIDKKRYYVLRVVSPSLEGVRTSCGLPIFLNFKGHAVPHHITIGVSSRFL